MHLLLVHQYFAPPSEAGGTRHYELTTNLVHNGHECTVVASDINYSSGQRAIEERGFVVEQRIGHLRVVRAYTYPTLHRSFVWRVVSFFSFMASSAWAALRAPRVDVVMGTSPPLFQAVSTWLVAALRRRPYLLEIRDLWPEFAIDIGVLKSPFLIRLSRWVERFLYRRATHLLVNSPAYRDYLLAKGLPAAKISLIANGVDPDMFPPTTDGRAMRDELQLDGKFVVTYAGALGMANDIGTILDAAAGLKDRSDIEFLIVGEGMERGRLQARADELGLKNLRFVGARVKSEMPTVLAASDACVATLKNIPMFRTTYPNKVFDYMAAGRPTVLAIDGVIREVVETAGGGLFVTPGDPDALAEAVRRLADDRDRARAMGDAARRYVSEHFNRHRQAEDFAELVVRLAPVQTARTREHAVSQVRQTSA